MLTFVLLSLLVLVHELGHFLAAKKFGVKVEEFGIGLPPKAITIAKKGETEYTLNWLPIGGFVRLLGEDVEPSLWDKINPVTRKRALFSKPAWQRAIIMLSGIGMNFVTGVLLFGIVYSVLGVPKMTGQQVVLTEVLSGSPAEMVGVQPGDVVRRVGDITITSSEQFVELVSSKKGEMISLYLAELTPDGTTSDASRLVMITPRVDPPEGEGALGVGVVSYPVINYEKKPWYTAPFWGVVEGMREAYGWSRYMIQLVLHPVELWKGIGGPVKVVQVGQEQAAMGWLSFLRFGGVISFNLAVFNLLPLPALDGGRLAFLLIEKIVGRKRSAKIERWVHGVGIFLLIGLLLAVTVRDLLG